MSERKKKMQQGRTRALEQASREAHHLLIAGDAEAEAKLYIEEDLDEVERISEWTRS